MRFKRTILSALVVGGAFMGSALGLDGPGEPSVIDPTETPIGEPVTDVADEPVTPATADEPAPAPTNPPVPEPDYSITSVPTTSTTVSSVAIMHQMDFPCEEDEVLGYHPRFGPDHVGCIHVQEFPATW